MSDETPPEAEVYLLFGHVFEEAHSVESHLKTVAVIAETLGRTPSFQWPADPAALPALLADANARVDRMSLGQVLAFVADRLSLSADRRLRLDMALGYRITLCITFSMLSPAPC